MTNLQFFLMFGSVVAGVAMLYIIYVRFSNAQFREKQKRNESLRQQYVKALKSSDKAAALAAGRAYYSALRNGRLSIYDEQAINNDLLTMK